MPVDLLQKARLCLQESCVDRKIRLSRETVSSCRDGFDLRRGTGEGDIIVGVPAKPALVTPSRLPARGFAKKSARLALAHAIAHIEFNAINLAWDAIARFEDMPRAYYLDWIEVAGEETNHFSLLRTYLNAAAHDYGDLDAHDGLWKMAEQTAHDVLDRMAIVPRVLEARGLDVTPAMIDKCANVDDWELVKILQLILEEEIDHVHKGSKWFHYLCSLRGLKPQATFITLMKRYGLAANNKRINRTARTEAGFSEYEMNYLEGNIQS